MDLERHQNIFLTGFMGAGKSTVGIFLAQLIGCPFHDLDSMIVEKEKRSISEIFATDGEVYFRNCETDLLKSLNAQNSAIYATGGGIVTREENRALMRHKGRIIYMQTSWAILRERLKSSVERPLVDTARSWTDLEQLLQRREPFYLDADLVVDTDGRNPMQIAQKIVSLLNQELNE